MSNQEKRNQYLELVASYAEDIVNAWPRMTLRNIYEMNKKMKALQEALNELKD